MVMMLGQGDMTTVLLRVKMEVAGIPATVFDLGIVARISR